MLAGMLFLKRAASSVLGLAALLLATAPGSAGAEGTAWVSGAGLPAVPASAEPPQSAPGASPGFERQIRFLTGSDFAPFTQEDLPEGGMITELVKRAMNRAAAGRDFRITFVNDWGPHLDVLLPEGAFDLGFPWYKPDCARLDTLSPDMRLRCTAYDFSDPFMEVVIGYYTHADNPFAGAERHGELTGARICRPRGYFTFDLDQAGLTEPQVTRLAPQTPAACFAALAAGEADIVTINVLVAEAEIALLKDPGIAEIPALASLQSLHVLSPKSNPFGKAYLAMIDRGLREMRDTGEWFEVVSRHLRQHAVGRAE